MVTNGSENQLKYNSKESQEDLGLNWYDYGARFYDAEIGRFHIQGRFSEKYLGLSPYNYVAGNPISSIDLNGDSIVEGSQKEWNKLTSKVTRKRDKLQGEIDRYNTKAAEKGWDAEKVASKIGNLGERVESLNASIQNFSNMENSTQFYSLNEITGELGGLTIANGVIVVNYSSTANFVHETTHAGQYEAGDMAFLGTKAMFQDLTDEAAAYKAQFAYSASSVSSITSSTKANSFGSITPDWVSNIIMPNGLAPYARKGFANTGQVRIGVYSTGADMKRAYPWDIRLTELPDKFQMRNYPNLIYKR